MVAAPLEILCYHEQVDAAAAEITAVLHVGNELFLNAVEIRINDIVLSDYLGCTPQSPEAKASTLPLTIPITA